MASTVTSWAPDAPAVIAITIPQRATYSHSFQWTVDNVVQSLTGYSAVMAVGRRAGRAPFFVVTSQAGEIVMEPAGATGQIKVVIPASKTALVTRNGWYSLDLVAPNGTVIPLAQGPVTADLSAISSDPQSTEPPVTTQVVVYGEPGDDMVPVWSSVNQRFEFGPGGGGGGGGGGVPVSATPPANPAQGDLWVDTTASPPTGGSSLVRAEYHTDSALIGASANMPWTYNDVQPDETLYHPLDLTDPQFPTVVEAGTYAVSVFIRAESWPGHPAADFAGVQMAARLSLDDEGFGWYVGATSPLEVDVVDADTRYGALTVSNTVWLPAGAVCAVYMHHSNGSADMPFTMFATVQKL